MIKTKRAPLPFYSDFLYGSLYNSLSETYKRDTEFQANVRLLGQSKVLIEAVRQELQVNQKVLQMGITYGPQIELSAQKTGAYNNFDVIDINPVQIRHKEGYMACPWVKFYEADATAFKTEEPYDAVVCYFLLSELPPISRAKVVNAALAAVKENGVVIFIDAHNPVPWHPLRYLVRMYNRLHHPFVEQLWNRDIDTLAKNRMDFTWRKSTYFGRMFQKVTAIRKPKKY